MNFLMMARKQLILSRVLRMGIAIGAIMILPHLSWFLDPFVAAKVENFFDLNTLQTIGLILTSTISTIQEKEFGRKERKKDSTNGEIIQEEKEILKNEIMNVQSIKEEHVIDVQCREENQKLKESSSYSKTIQFNESKEKKREKFEGYGVEIDSETNCQILLKSQMSGKESIQFENQSEKFEQEEHQTIPQEKKILKMKKKERKVKEMNENENEIEY